MVRIFKNMRSKLVEDGVLADGIAPSYFIEGLLYNVPNEKFVASLGDTFCNCLNWLLEPEKTRPVCANEQYYLLGDDIHVQWAPKNKTVFLNALVNLWNTWGQ